MGIKTSRKLQALARVALYMGILNRKFLMKTFQFSVSYCSLVWIFQSRALNNKINRLHKRFLRFIYNDKQLTFEEPYDDDDSVSIHVRNSRH